MQTLGPVIDSLHRKVRITEVFQWYNYYWESMLFFQVIQRSQVEIAFLVLSSSYCTHLNSSSQSFQKWWQKRCEYTLEMLKYYYMLETKKIFTSLNFILHSRRKHRPVFIWFSKLWSIEVFLVPSNSSVCSVCVQCKRSSKIYQNTAWSNQILSWESGALCSHFRLDTN